MYQIDALEVLGLLARAGCADVRMQNALDLVLTKQCSDGTWILETNFNDRFQVAVEKRGKPSKWITFNALRILKQVAMA
jgi:hypothetical protein